MAAAPLPPDEEQRLRDLFDYDLLDTAPEEAFDRLTRLASSLLEMPIAVVSLVDRERQWFKSRVGMPLTETPRDQAFCAHAILGCDLMVVPDAIADPRFVDNPMVTGMPGIRFYAGAPLIQGDGSAVGTLCVIDRQPRQLDERERRLLQDIAGVAVDELRLRRSLKSLSLHQLRVEQELTQAQRMSERLLPSPAALEHLRRRTGVEAAGIILPTSTLGGDYWTAGHDDLHVILFLADVCGHGVAAALQASAIHAILSPLPAFLGDLERMEAHLDTQIGSFADATETQTAALYLAIDPGQRMVRHFGAGFPDAWLIGRDGEARAVSGAGLPFGFIAGVRRDHGATLYRAGDLLIAFSDGLIEVEDGAGRRLGRDAPTLFAGPGGAPEPDLTVQVLVERALARFIARFGTAVADDLMLVAARLP